MTPTVPMSRHAPERWFARLARIARERSQRSALWWKILQNSGLIVASNGLTKLFFQFALMVIARNLGPAQYGQYSFLISYVMLAAVLPEMGMDAILTRSVATNPEDSSRLLGGAFTLRMTGILAVTCGAYFIFDFFPHSSSALHPGLLLALAYVFAFSLGAFCESYFRAHMSMGVPSIAKIGAKLGVLALAFWFARNTRGERADLRLWAFLLATVLPEIAATLFLFFSLFRRAVLKWSIGWSIWRPILRDSWPIGVATISVMAYNRLDLLILPNMAPAAIVGNYASAINVAEIWAGITGALCISLLPVFSRMLQTGDTNGFWKVYKQSVHAAMMITVPACLICTLWAPEIISLLYGPRYTDAPAALKVLMWGQLVNTWAALYNTILIAEKRTTLVLTAYLSAAFLNVILNLLFIPINPLLGASIAKLIAFATPAMILATQKNTRRLVAVSISYTAPILLLALLCAPFSLVRGGHGLYGLVLFLAAYTGLMGCWMLRKRFAGLWAGIREVH